MAGSTKNQVRNEAHGAEDEDDDYMGDLSRFLPTESSDPPKKLPSKKAPDDKSSSVQLSKRSKGLNWQERRKVERERRQIEEDEQTIASTVAPISESNIGFKMLKQMGYKPGSAIGKIGLGIAEPVSLEIRRSRAGIGRDDPHKEKRKREEIESEQKIRKVEELMEDFGSRQKSQWRIRRIAMNFSKAKAAIDQLENREVVPENDEEKDGEQDEEEEEEQITEEDLQEILMKLRDEHRYCLFCGFQYESTEALLDNCPGIDEDDH